MNVYVQDYVRKLKDKLTGKLLEVGGMDHNGSLREILPHALVTDMAVGRNVDVVCAAENLMEHFGRESFDSVVSADALEHMENWKEALQNMWGVLKTDGWLVITMASLSKGYHGYPGDYVRLTPEDIGTIWPGAVVEQLGGPSQGWYAQKTFQVLDFAGIVPIVPVKPK